MLDGVVEGLAKRRAEPMEDPGMMVAAISWMLLVAMVFTIILRFSLKLAKSTDTVMFGLDDVFVGLAALFSIGQTAAVSVEARNALGQHRRDLNPSQFSIFQKTEYASCLLYIANMGCARISVCLLIKKVLPGPCAKYTASVFAICSALWTVSGVLVAAFPCALPNPWEHENNKCFDLVKFVNYIGITNIIVELMLVSIPLFVWNLRLTAGRRVSVSTCFLSRLSIVIAVAVQLYYHNLYFRSADDTYDYWRTVMCVQVAQNLSVITACIPCLHPFILGILSGATRTDCLRFDCSGYNINKLFPFKRTSRSRMGRSKRPKFDATSSQCSTTPITIDESYCKPLATYGLDRSSSNTPSGNPNLSSLNISSPICNRLPSNIATPAKDPNPPANVFQRTVEYPRSTSRPPTAHSNKDPLIFPAVARSKSQKSLPPIPQRLSEVGVLPPINWESESSRDGSSGRGSPERKRDSTYVFNREKVISVPEDNMVMFEKEYWRKYPPPPQSGEK